MMLFNTVLVRAVVVLSKRHTTEIHWIAHRFAVSTGVCDTSVANVERARDALS